MKAWQAFSNSCEGVWGKLPVFLRRAVLSGWCRKIGAIARASSEPSFFFLPWVSWYYAGFQRPQQMARALAELECPIFYHEPVTAGPADVRGIVGKRRSIGFKEICPSLFLVRCPRFMLPDLLQFSSLDVIVMSWPWQAQWFAPGSTALLAYEMVDDHSLLNNSDESQRTIHQKWVEEADIVVATADNLLAALQSSRDDAMLLPNGVAPGDWSSSHDSEPPPDMARARKSEVLIGYMGAIASWFDWPLWEQLARSRPSWAFVLIGFAWDDTGRGFLDKARGLPNVHYLGPKPHNNLCNYVAHFDVATTPFLLNPITHACSPLKLFEYMACGKPVVCTPMQEVKKYRGVHTAGSVTEFLEKIAAALIQRNDPLFLKTLREEVEANTWTSRAQHLIERVRDIRYRQQGIPRRRLKGSDDRH